MGFSPTTRGRAWMGTIHIENMKKAGLKKEQYEDPEFLADFFINLWEKSGKGRTAGIAVCESKTGVYHAHIACYGNTTTLKKVADILYESHIEPQLAGKERLTAYLKKKGEFEEKGETVLFLKNLDAIQDRPGKRNDLEEIEELLNKGYTPNQIFEESFRYRKYEKMIKSHYLEKRIKETPLIKNMWGEYHYGSTGTGKTYTYYKLCKLFTPEEVYLCNDYSNASSSGGGFDFYANNPGRVILLDELRGNIPYAQLLSIMDVYSRSQQHCRFQNTYNLWEYVIICSIYPPEEVYKLMVDETKRSIDSFRQFLRRLNVIVYHYKKNGEYKTFEMPACEYTNAEDMMKKAQECEMGKRKPELLSICSCMDNSILSKEKTDEINESEKNNILKELGAVPEKGE